MQISNLCWRGCRDGLFKYPHSYLAEVRGVLHYLVDTYASIDKDNLSEFPQETSNLEFPDDGVKIPSGYSDDAIRAILYELTNREVTIEINGNYKIVHY